MAICNKIGCFVFISLFIGVRLQADPFSQIRDERYVNASIFTKDDRPHTDEYLVVPRFKKFQAQVRTWPLKDRIALGYLLYVPVMTLVISIFC